MNLLRLIDSYYQFRHMRRPEFEDAFLFLTSEVGELADAIVSEKPGWTRNNPDKLRSVEAEIGDCMQMLAVTAQSIGLDPVECMKAKWRSKGWEEVER